MGGEGEGEGGGGVGLREPCVLESERVLAASRRYLLKRLLEVWTGLEYRTQNILRARRPKKA